MRGPGHVFAACVAMLALAAGCGEVTGEPTAESPAPSPQPTPTTPSASTSTAGPGRQPPLPSTSDVDVQVALDTVTALDGATPTDAATYAEQALRADGWDVTRVRGSVVATRGTAPDPGADREVVTAPLGSPAELGVLLTVAHALSSRSSMLPLVLVAQGATSYVDQLPAADRSGLVPVDVDLPAGAGTEDLRMLAVELVTTL